MKKKNGFTLIELLAVIVILAIIALIATPIVLGLINKARKGAATDSAYGVRKEAQLVYSTALMEHPAGFNKIVVDFSKEVTKDGKKYAEAKYYATASTTDENAKTDEIYFEIDGTKPSSGIVTINGNGKVTYENIVITGYNCTIPESGEVTCGGSGSNNSQESTPSGNEQGGTTPSGNEQGGTTPSGNEQGGTTPTIATCPGCQFIFTTSTYAIEGSPSASEYSSDIPAGTTTDYTTLGGHPYFLGIIPSQTNPNKIGRAFSCGIENGTAFCVEGYDTSKFDSNVSTLNATIPDCDASSEFDETGCSDESDFVAHIFSFGVVDVYDDFGFCYVDTEGYFECTVS